MGGIELTGSSERGDHVNDGTVTTTTIDSTHLPTSGPQAKNGIPTHCGTCATKIHFNPQCGNA